MHMYAGGDIVRGEGGAVLTLVSEPYLYSHFRCNMTLTNMHSIECPLVFLEVIANIIFSHLGVLIVVLVVVIA